MKLLYLACSFALPILAMDLTEPQTKVAQPDQVISSPTHLPLAEQYPLAVQYFTQRCSPTTDGRAPFPATIVALIKKYLTNNHLPQIAQISKFFMYEDNSLFSRSNHADMLFSIFSPDERTIITAKKDCIFVKNLALAGEESVKKIVYNSHADCAQFLFSSDGKKLFIANHSSLSMLDLTNWENITLKEISRGPFLMNDSKQHHIKYSNFMAINQDNTKLLVCSQSSVKCFNLTDIDNVVSDILITHSAPAVGVSFTRDNKAVLAGFADGTIVCYYLSDQPQIMHVESISLNYNNDVNSPYITDKHGVVFNNVKRSLTHRCGFSGDGKWAVCINSEISIFYNIDQFLSVGTDFFHSFLVGADQSIKQHPNLMQFKQDHTMLFVGYVNRVAEFIKLDTHPIKICHCLGLKSSPNYVEAIAFHPSARYALTIFYGGRAQLWDLSNFDAIKRTQINGFRRLSILQGLP